MLKLLSKQFRKPQGMFGHFIANRMNKRNHYAYQALDKHARISDNMKLFEIGFGPGYGLKYFQDNYNITYFGIDYSKLMYSNALKTMKKKYPSNTGSLYFGDFLEFNHANNDIDLVLFANVTYFWKDLLLPFSRIYNMLNDNGRLVFYMSDKSLLENKTHTNTKHFNLHDKKTVKEALLNSGFKDLKVTPVPDENSKRMIIEASK